MNKEKKRKESIDLWRFFWGEMPKRKDEEREVPSMGSIWSGPSSIPRGKHPLNFIWSPFTTKKKIIIIIIIVF
jgi:hypothetical protein